MDLELEKFSQKVKEFSETVLANDDELTATLDRKVNLSNFNDEEKQEVVRVMRQMAATQQDLRDEMIYAHNAEKRRMSRGCEGPTRLKGITTLGSRVTLLVCSSPQLDSGVAIEPMSIIRYPYTIEDV